jgi:hypothetical protein
MNHHRRVDWAPCWCKRQNPEKTTCLRLPGSAQQVFSTVKPSRCLMNNARSASLTVFAEAPVVGLPEGHILLPPPSLTSGREGSSSCRLGPTSHPKAHGTLRLRAARYDFTVTSAAFNSCGIRRVPSRRLVHRILIA